MTRHFSVHLTKAADDANEQFWKAFRMVHLADFWLSAKITIEMPCLERSVCCSCSSSRSEELKPLGQGSNRFVFLMMFTSSEFWSFCSIALEKHMEIYLQATWGPCKETGGFSKPLAKRSSPSKAGRISRRSCTCLCQSKAVKKRCHSPERMVHEWAAEEQAEGDLPPWHMKAGQQFLPFWAAEMQENYRGWLSGCDELGLEMWLKPSPVCVISCDPLPVSTHWRCHWSKHR